MEALAYFARHGTRKCRHFLSFPSPKAHLPRRTYAAWVFFHRNAFLSESKRVLQNDTLNRPSAVLPSAFAPMTSASFANTSCKFNENGSSVIEREKSQTCWKCGDTTKVSFFCDKCGIIQPPNEDENLFTVLGFPTKFDIEDQELTHRFRQLQRSLHPDRFTQKSEEERNYSDHQSALVNKSYQTILKPLSRGLYLLQLHDATLEEGEVHLDPTFLMEIMEINEELAETQDIDVVRHLGDRNSKELTRLMAIVAQAFAEGDIERAKETLARLKYYANIDDKVKDIESKFAEQI